MAIKKKIVEKATSEKYASKKAMMKHEKGESKAEMKKEYGKPKSPAKMNSAAYMKKSESPAKQMVKSTAKAKSPAKMKKC